jgi:hypothetical protein
VVGVLDRVVLAIAGIVAAMIVIGIILVVTGANPDNGIVAFFLDLADGLASPFEDFFTLDDPDTQTAVNWGVAAGVYLLIAFLIAAVLGRIASRSSASE